MRLDIMRLIFYIFKYAKSLFLVTISVMSRKL